MFATPGAIWLAHTAGITTEGIGVVADKLHCLRLHPRQQLMIAVVEARERGAALLWKRNREWMRVKAMEKVGYCSFKHTFPQYIHIFVDI